ncbi:MAG: S8 family serine peptidase [Bacteriovoracaceae bacterium]
MRKFFILGLVFILAGCEVGDNQLIVPTERQEIANPKPIARDFIKINKRHKILMAVIDFGVDYNHPLLQDNLHFTLDQNGKPVGLGYDFVGNDKWPSPYIAMTADIDSQSSPSAKNAAKQLIKHVNAALDIYPNLAGVISPYRRIDQEADSGSQHGTHVAGLMTYDAPELGLLSYRVLPVNQVYKNGELIQDEFEQKNISKNILKALIKAVKDGVKVINLSLAMEIKRNDNPVGSKEDLDFKEVFSEVEDFIKANPDVAFVTASGNGSSWINRSSHQQLPCGIEASNIICVGAVDKDGDIASFTNIPLINSPFVLAPGVDIISTAPTKMCQLDNSKLSTSQTTDLVGDDDSSPWNDPDSAKEFLEKLSRNCQVSGLMSLTGTSMASPIVARQIALIRVQYPELNGAEAIIKLLEKSENFHVGPLNLKKLKVELPSWKEAPVKILKF